MTNSFKSFLLWLIAGLLLYGLSPLMAQSDIWIDPNRSDPTKRRSLIMNANNVESMVGNWGNVGQGSNPISGVWPRGSGHDHIYEFTGIVAAEVPDTGGVKRVIVSDAFIDGGGTAGEFDPVTNIEYKFHPLSGYFNEVQGQDQFANSLNPLSWAFSWPGKDATWDGKWNGFFGLNQFNADQEAMYYIDDTWNSEFPFYPYQDDLERRGLGMQMHVRLFQWAHPLAKDILFFYFEISNAGDFTFNAEQEAPVFFGGFGDIGPGGRGTVDDDAWFDDQVDMVYGWDHDNMGVWTRNRDIPPGYLGWKFLESPGVENDQVDNDSDGLIDESRDNEAGDIIFGPVGIYGDAKDHFEGDEDGDWIADVDDVGADGIDEFGEGYPGPDADGTEGNGMPDQGEPNFGRLDNDESDQIGLTAFSAPIWGSILVSDEEAMWPRLQPGFFVQPTQTVNQFWIFASGPVNLEPGKTERFSTCYLFAFTEQALFQTAGVAQRIFDSDYRFAKPPRQPVLKAIPGDKKVTLVWNSLSELSRDPIYGFDFEGYRIYRATDPQFLDVEVITDSRGNPVFRVPITQFDKDNGLTGPHPLQFGEEIGAPTGIRFHMGDDTGLQHYFVDEGLVNGRTYYYAITGYDAGYDDDFFERGINPAKDLLPITPSESPASIVVTEGLITRSDPNTVRVTPNARASDVLAATTNRGDSLVHAVGPATGRIGVQIIDEALVKDNEYEVTFGTDVMGARVGETQTATWSVYNKTTEQFVVDNAEVPWSFSENRRRLDWTGELLDDGVILTFDNRRPDTSYARINSDWSADTETNWTAQVRPFTSTSSWVPVTFVVEWGPDFAVSDTAFRSVRANSFHYTNFKVYELDTGEPLNFLFVNSIRRDSTAQQIDEGEQIVLAVKDDPAAARYTTSWTIAFRAPRDEAGVILPEDQWIRPSEGDRFILRNQINFQSRDVYSFETSARVLNDNANGDDVLDRIRVVPNPYVVSSILESQPFLSGRGERFIRFTNLPAKCTVRIFTVNGDLVRTLQHESIENGSLPWDLKSKDDLEVAFGLYVYHVDAPGVGVKIGKFAIIN